MPVLILFLTYHQKVHVGVLYLLRVAQLRFCKRPTLLLIFVNQKRSKEDFQFYEKIITILMQSFCQLSPGLLLLFWDSFEQGSLSLSKVVAVWRMHSMATLCGIYSFVKYPLKTFCYLSHCLFSPPYIQGREKVGLQLGVCETQRLSLYYSSLITVLFSM